jgi:hypothetical protein
MPIPDQANNVTLWTDDTYVGVGDSFDSWRKKTNGLRTLMDGSVTNAKVAADAAIVDTKLATIATAGKVSNSATTATTNNTATTIVLRDGSGFISVADPVSSTHVTSKTYVDNYFKPYGDASLWPNQLGHASVFRIRLGIYMFGSNSDIAWIASKATPAGGYSSVWNNTESDENWFKQYSYYFEFSTMIAENDGVGAATPLRPFTLDWENYATTLNWTIPKATSTSEPTSASVTGVGARTLMNDNSRGAVYLNRITQFASAALKPLNASVRPSVVTRVWEFNGSGTGLGCNYTKTAVPTLNNNYPAGVTIDNITVPTNNGAICFTLNLPA